MNQNHFLFGAIVLLSAAVPAWAEGGSLDGVKSVTDARPAFSSGIDQQNVDDTIRIQDDAFMHVNGAWMRKTEIPADKAAWGSFDSLRDNSLAQLRSIIEIASNETGKKAGTSAQRIGDLYDSFMDEAKLEQLGISPLKKEFDRIAALRDKKDIPALVAHYNRVGITGPYDIVVHQDNKNSTEYVADFQQSGLGLPDRDYYLRKDDARLQAALAKYQEHITKMLAMAGDEDAAAKAEAIVALETRLAEIQWSKTQNRDPIQTYNRIELARLADLAPEYDWKSYLASAGLHGKSTYAIISQPSYLTGFAKVFQATPLAIWKDYFAWHVLSSSAPYLSRQFVDENFAFYGTVLQGQSIQAPRWKSAVRLEESALGQELGKLYVARYFRLENKARIDKLVANLLEAFHQSIDTLDWMGAEAKTEAQAKLASLMVKVGYPAQWRDYSALHIDKTDLVGNVRRANEFEYLRNIGKLGRPIDRAEWAMTPQTVNAYYNPELNEVVFPAAILQPPFFNIDADEAVNYGAIGAVISHQISCGFDAQGSQYDRMGNLRDWWTREDRERFNAKVKALVKQYGAYSPVPGYKVNGVLTLGENVADNVGLEIAYKAYQLSLGGKEAPVIDGLTGDQRFYLGFAQVWRNKTRDNAAIVRLKTDPHAPAQFRANGALRNQPGFYSAFDVKEGDGMYLPPDQRVIVW